MRVLFTFIGGNGHFQPLAPIAHSAAAAGHTVAIAGSGSMVKAIEAAGFHAFATDTAGDGVRPRLPLLEPDQERAERELTEIARSGARPPTFPVPNPPYRYSSGRPGDEPASTPWVGRLTMLASDTTPERSRCDPWTTKQPSGPVLTMWRRNPLVPTR